MPVISSEGGTVTMYRFAMYDIRSNELVQSKRWATEMFIDSIKARKVGAGAVVKESEVDADGLTALGFDPQPAPGGFQREVGGTLRP